MRKLAALLSILATLSATATEMWRWKDADGVVHYSDRPVPGAERIDVHATQAPSSAPDESTSTPPAETQTQSPVPAGYSRCAVTAPAKDEVFNAVNSVAAIVEVEPALQDGHHLQVFLNGRAYTEWPEGVLAYTLQNLYRGSYVLSARIIDGNGRPVCTAPSITFHVRQPSVMAPARRRPGG